jgi:crossover junction endodeoxyribonuclease RuvC
VTRVLALDLSLTATGLAVADWEHVHTANIDPGRALGQDRLRLILINIAQIVRDARPDVVVIEDLPSHAGKAAGVTLLALAELHGIVKFWLHPRVPYALVNVTHLKLYALGKGSGANTGKEQVLLAVERRYGQLTQVRTNDEADALVLAAMALHHYDKPLIDVPKTHSIALTKVARPALPARPGHPAAPGGGACSSPAALREHPARRSTA